MITLYNHLNLSINKIPIPIIKLLLSFPTIFKNYQLSLHKTFLIKNNG